MGSDLIQYLSSGLTVGSIYALIALGFTLIYNSTHVANFAQGDFAMIGAMTTVFAGASGMPLILAGLTGICAAALAGLLLYTLAIRPARHSSVLGLIVLTIGASIFAKGFAQLVFDKRFHSLPPWLGASPVDIFGAAVQTQSFVVLAGAAIIVVVLAGVASRTLVGKGIAAVSQNALAATLIGLNVRTVVSLAFVVSAVIGGVAGILSTPITLTSYDAGTLLSLKGFAAAMIGGMGSPVGAVLGGLLLGVGEAFGSGLISSAYKDAFAFLLILIVLAARPQGLVGSRVRERV